MNSFPGRPSSLSKPNTSPPSSATRSLPNSSKRSAVNSQRALREPASSIVSANLRSRSTTNSASSCASRPPPTTSPLSSTTARACPREGGGGTSAGPGNPRPCPRQKDHLQPQRPARDPTRLQSPLSRISLQPGRLLGRHSRARPSHPTPSRQWPQSQGPELFQPRRTDPALGFATSRLQHRRPAPRRPPAARRPMLSRLPLPATRPPAPPRHHQTRHRHLSLLSHPRWSRCHRCRSPPHRAHHHSRSRLTNLLTTCKHSGRKRLTTVRLLVARGRQLRLRHLQDCGAPNVAERSALIACDVALRQMR